MDKPRKSMIPLERLCSSWNNKGDGFNVAVVDRLEPSHNLILMDLVELVYEPSGFLNFLR